MESSWQFLAMLIGWIIVLVAFAEAGLALVSRLRRFFYEQNRYDISLERFEEQLMTARVRRLDQYRESSTWNGQRKFRVASKVDEGGGISSFYLEAHDAKPIPPYRPGQYLTFALKIPGQSRPEIRCYSLSDAADPTHYRVTIKRVLGTDAPDTPPGLVSNFFHDAVESGDIVDVLSPEGDFYLDLTRHQPIVLIGGGVGITPMIAMLRVVAKRDFDRDIWLFYGARTQDELIMTDVLVDLAQQSAGRFQLHFCCSRGIEETPHTDVNIHFHQRRVDIDLLKETLQSNNYEYYICGPAQMMESLTKGLRDWGVPDDKVFFEAFGPATVATTATAGDVIAGSATDVTVRFERSGISLPWDANTGNLLAFATANNISIPSGCRAGSCKSCIVAVKSGDVENIKRPGHGVDDGSCLTCVCVPTTDIVLDA